MEDVSKLVLDCDRDGNNAFFDTANSEIREHCKQGGLYQDTSGALLLPTERDKQLLLVFYS